LSKGGGIVSRRSSLLKCFKSLDGLSLFVNGAKSLLDSFLEVIESSEDVEGLLVLVPWFIVEVVPQDWFKLSESGSL
jgi:hypothetical protein